MKKITFPLDNEYALYYHAFLQEIDKNAALLPSLRQSAKEIITLYKSLSDQQLLYRYNVGKWSMKDVLNHLVDVEMVFLGRAMRFARKDKTPQAFFDENEYAIQAQADKKSLIKLLKEFQSCRNLTIAFFNNLPSGLQKETGVASRYQMSVRACAWIIYAHERHHLRILQEHYLNYT